MLQKLHVSYNLKEARQFRINLCFVAYVIFVVTNS